MRGGSAHGQLGFDRNCRNAVHAAFDLVEQCTSRDLTHLLQGLPHGREWRISIGGTLNVIEADNGYIVRDPQVGFLKSSDRTDGRNVIVGKQSSKRPFTREQLFWPQGSQDSGLDRLP